MLEEVGLAGKVARLLVVQLKAAAKGTPASLMFVFDSEPVDRGEELSLQAAEIAETFWLDDSEAVRRHTSGGRARLAMAFRAKREGLTVYMGADRDFAF